MADLDDWQIQNIFFRAGERDKARKGIYWPMPNKGEKRKGGLQPFSRGGFKEMFWRIKRWQGAPENLIPELWDKYLELNPRLWDERTGA